MKKLLSIFTTVVTVALLSLTACAEDPNPHCWTVEFWPSTASEAPFLSQTFWGTEAEVKKYVANYDDPIYQEEIKEEFKVSDYQVKYKKNDKSESECDAQSSKKSCHAIAFLSSVENPEFASDTTYYWGTDQDAYLMKQTLDKEFQTQHGLPHSVDVYFETSATTEEECAQHK